MSLYAGGQVWVVRVVVVVMCVRACGRGDIGGGGRERAGGETVVVVTSCAGGGTLVGGDGRGGCEPCRRGDVDGGR